MKVDLGVDPTKTLIGIGLFIVGATAEIYVLLHINTAPLWLAFTGPLVFGLGSGYLIGQWRYTRRIRRVARQWAVDHPEDDDDEDGPYEDGWVGEEQPGVARRKRAGRGERRTRRLAQQTPTEDNPHWTAYAARWVDKPGNPTDESDKKDDSD